jgi:hypothetical protein
VLPYRRSEVVMVYPSNLLRLVVLGRLYGPAEQFSFSLHLRPLGDPDDSPFGVPDGIIDGLRALWATQPLISAAPSITSVKLNLIGPNGRYVRDHTIEEIIDPPITSTSTARQIPQVALAVTLLTGAERGRASRGRFYLPAPNVALEDDGRISQASALAIAEACSDFLVAVNTAVPNWRVCVASEVGTGQTRDVLRVGVGRVLDTIRRRRNELDENRQEVSVPMLP